MSSEQNVTPFLLQRSCGGLCRGYGAVHALQSPTPFASLLEAGARVLEIGCGSGRDSAWLLSQGFEVHPTDGVAEMAAQAATGSACPLLCCPRRENAVQDYDGVWANACLLHVPRADLSDVLQRIQRALRPCGLFYASYKAVRQKA